MIESFEHLHINMRVQLHLDYIVECGNAHEDFQRDLMQFCERDVTCIEEARLHVSIAKLVSLVCPEPEDFADTKLLIGACLLRAEEYLLFCDQRAGRA